MNKFLFPFLVLFCSAMLFFNPSLSAQQVDNKSKIIVQYDSLNKFVPKEKLYLHFDKSIYTTQDTIWFKAYLLDESLITAAQFSGLIYIELIDYNGEVVKSLALPTASGLTWGGIAIQSNYEPGNYTLRAYTNWMQNFGEQYFFKKELKIVSLTGTATAPKPKANNLVITKTIPTSYLKGNQKFDVQFLPEGGSWVAGLTQKMAFKAIKANGKGVEIAGEVIDSKKNVILQFRSNTRGMGYFKLNPKADEEYTVVFKNPSDLKNQLLPKALPNGIALQIVNDFQSDSLSITIYNSSSPKDLYLIGQSRGTLSFISQLKVNFQTKTIKVGKDIFPSGMNQIILLDANKQSINERSFFLNHKNELKIAINSAQPIYTNRDSIPLHLKVTDQNGSPIIGSFSMAVTDDGQVGKDSFNDGHILSYLLLTSDLKGEIENPGQYFSQVNEQNHEAIEALVLTQGWASYYNRPLKTQNFKAEKDFTISGRVDNILKKPVAKANVSLFGRNKKNVLLQTVANDKGEFVFNNLPVLDSASFVIQALNAKDRRGTLGIQLNEFKRPTISPIPQIKADESADTVDHVIGNLIKVQQQAYINTNGGLMLKEISVVGKKGVRNSRNLNGPGEADLTISPAELEKIPKKMAYEILQEKVAGFMSGTKGRSQVLNFFVYGNYVKFIIDGIYLDQLAPPIEGNDGYYRFVRSYLDEYYAEDIAGIEVMNSRRYTSAYDAKYLGPLANVEYCFIEITTKTGIGTSLRKAANMYLYKPMDYGDLKVFYSPKYTTTTKANLGTDLRSTIYWIPNLVTNQKGELSTSFFAADKKGTYTVWLEGTDMRGNFGFKTIKLQIK